MKKHPVYGLLPLALGLLFSCQSADTTSSVQTDEAAGLASFSEASYRTYVTALASDELEGRKPFTAGETKTLAYLEQEFKALGVAPGNGDSYQQEVSLVEIRTTADPSMDVQTPKGVQRLKGREDYVIWAGTTEPSIQLQNAELVFAGFGIVAPEYGWNDYDGLDVKDKVVVVLVNDPGFYTKDSSLFKGSAMTYYGRWTYKFEEAARQGAKGCLIIHATEPAGYPFAIVQNNWNTGKQYLDTRANPSYKCPMEGWLSQEAASRLLQAAGSSMEAALEKALKPDFKPEPLNMRLSTRMTTESQYAKSYNFIARIPGSEAPEETIIYTAHWDHLGIGKPDAKGDSIFNGAVDNASGVAGLIEIAKAFKSLPEQPRRSLVFLAVTAEEQGLLGSAYYAQNPIYPLEKTVANLNVDMLNPFGPTRDIVVIGMGQSELDDYLQAEAQKADRYIVAENTPEAGLYYRSDHFNFAKAGVPALFTGAGIDHLERGKEASSQDQQRFVSEIYHKAADQVTGDWNMEGILSDLRLFFSMGRRLAYGAEWPGWKEGSEFKATRDAQQGTR
ncbi:M28 family metallopeptidase [Cesiribacter andamanensis]|uniref:Bacterial leucyl aminopeptidase n=1 Tax=Cesiribacter andamanensis AMV16 TaxID=1279009 RepID=M7MZX9_9BACT|nr:M28 family metallopeptidase [Cesiribacter andamanensis]EMR01993.1 Bacterial leucyl aminopeptidase precursor [Cesiribacter andamanensis AMV16]